jgi:hypothetical protein
MAVLPADDVAGCVPVYRWTLGMPNNGNRATWTFKAGSATDGAGASIAARMAAVPIVTYGMQSETIPAMPNQNRRRLVASPLIPLGRKVREPARPA